MQKRSPREQVESETIVAKTKNSKVVEVRRGERTLPHGGGAKPNRRRDTMSWGEGGGAVCPEDLLHQENQGQKGEPGNKGGTTPIPT